MAELFKFASQFFQEPKRHFGLQMLGIACMAGLCVFPALYLSPIDNPVTQILLYACVAVPAFLAAWAFVTTSRPADTGVKPDDLSRHEK